MITYRLNGLFHVNYTWDYCPQTYILLSFILAKRVIICDITVPWMAYIL